MPQAKSKEDIFRKVVSITCLYFFVFVAMQIEATSWIEYALVSIPVSMGIFCISMGYKR